MSEQESFWRSQGLNWELLHVKLMLFLWAMAPSELIPDQHLLVWCGGLEYSIRLGQIPGLDAIMLFIASFAKEFLKCLIPSHWASSVIRSAEQHIYTFSSSLSSLLFAAPRRTFLRSECKYSYLKLLAILVLVCVWSFTPLFLHLFSLVLQCHEFQVLKSVPGDHCYTDMFMRKYFYSCLYGEK